MPIPYKLKHALANRYAMTAILFLLITLWGGATALLGTLELQTACAGYLSPAAQGALLKADSTAPHRTPNLPAASLDAASAPVQSWPQQLSAKTAAAETAVTKALEEDHSLIEFYGAFQRLADRTVVEDAAEPQYSVVRLDNGSLTFVGEGTPDPQVQAAELKRLQLVLDGRDIPLLYVQTPSKLEPGNTALPYGVSDPSNDCADRLLAELDALDIDHLDLRRTLADAGGDWSRWFYKTDHHWTQEAAFLAFQTLCRRLEEYDQTLPSAQGTKTQPIRIPARVTDPASYDVTTLPSFFLGSQGKRVGSLFAGTDDFPLWSYQYPSLFRYAASSIGARYGDWDEALLFSQQVEEKDYYHDTPYTYYSGGDFPLAQTTNYYNPQGPRILLVRDSFACAVTPYLALASSQLTTLDPRYFTGDFLSCVDSVKPDVVIVLYSSGMVRSETYYRLLAQPAAPSKSDSLKWLDDSSKTGQK